MLPYIWTILRTYAPILTLPVAAAVGVIGYALESVISDKYTPYKKSIEEQRADRMLQEVDSIRLDKKLESGVPKSIFERNMSPQLRRDANSSDK